MTDSILTSTKKNLGLDASYTAFDPDLILYINGVFSTLNQLGIGPEAGFAIDDDSAVWSDFIGTDPRLNSVKTLVFLSVKLVFDPPATSFAIEAMERQIEELTWRINVYRESYAWTDPSGEIPPDTIIDGGGA